MSWLLKYLSRPLVANLTSTFNQLAPLLGKTRQKQYVRRFASEAFAFLLRRVRDPSEIVQVMLSDMDNNEEFSEAVGNVFVESMKAPGYSLHSKALALFNALAQNSRLMSWWALLMIVTEASQSATRGVLEQVLYNTSKDKISPLLDNILEMLSGDTRDLAIDLLQICCTIKGGSKVTDWSKFKTPVLDLFASNVLDLKPLWLLVATVVSKSDTITSKRLTEEIFKSFNESTGQRMYVFCRLVGKLNSAYFQKWVLEEFVKYPPCGDLPNIRHVNSSDEAQFDEVALTIISLQQASLLTPSSKSDGIPRLNGYLVAKESKFIKHLESRLLDNNFQDLRELWRNLQLVKVLELRSDNLAKAQDRFFVESLTLESDYRTSLVGTLLSLVPDEKSSVAYFDALMNLNSSQIELYVSDVTFLEGAEALILKFPKYRPPLILLTLELPTRSFEISYDLSGRHFSEIFHVRHTQFEKRLFAYCCLLPI